MENKLLSLAFSELKKKKYDCYLLGINNEHLYEFTRPIDNYLMEITGFTGDTASLAICKGKAYLFVDGRFTVQAKKEIKDKRISIVNIDSSHTKIDFLINLFKDKHYIIALNSKKESISVVKKYETLFKKLGHKLVFDNSFLINDFKKCKMNYFNLTSSPLFLLDKKYITDTSKIKIKNAISILISDENLDKNVKVDNIYYVTSSLEEIAFLTNIRYRFCDIDNHNVLFDAFMVVNKKKSYLYIKDYLEKDAEKYIFSNGIEVRDYNDFYSDICKLKDKKYVYLDPSLNNYYVHKKIGNGVSEITSPLLISSSIKGERELNGLAKCNIIDGVSLTKAIFTIKKSLDKKANPHNVIKTEWDVKKLVDDYRKKYGGKLYLCPSFDTIASFKENSAICHYSPDKNKSKKITYNSLLLIDSGGNYLCGSTDITRTISLYKDKKSIPDDIKKHYTLVLSAMLNLANQKFPHGLTGLEIDIIARSNLYNNYFDFNHGTGHGIGYVSNVHEGPNRVSRGIRENIKYNVLETNQVLSDEPGIYIENKYGIRIENDLVVKNDKSNVFNDFMRFEHLTLCPFDMDLIDVKYMDDNVISVLNSYNKKVYKALSKYLNSEENIWLKSMTREVRK